MIQLDEHLELFAPILEKLADLGDNNIYIGGTLALQIQGIEVGRDAGDLDMVVYQATEDQIEYLKALRIFEVPNTSCFEWYQQRSHKYKKEGLVLDILLDGNDKPAYCTQYKSYNVNPVKTVIRAKAFYERVKDMRDLLNLKNLNFNG